MSNSSSDHSSALLVIISGLLMLYVCRHYLPTINQCRSLESNNNCEVLIEVRGDVKSSGFYCFHVAPTIAEALSAAGGIVCRHDHMPQDKGSKLTTGTSLLVENTEDGIKTKVSPMSGGKKLLFGIPMDLNTATAEELENIPGIGPKISLEIVLYRQKHGHFSQVDELKKVRGVGSGKLARIRKYLTVKYADPLSFVNVENLSSPERMC